jgi:hypothetical protein
MQCIDGIQDTRYHSTSHCFPIVLVATTMLLFSLTHCYELVFHTCTASSRVVQWLKKLSQCLAILERLTWDKSNKLCNNLKIISDLV